MAGCISKRRPTHKLTADDGKEMIDFTADLLDICLKKAGDQEKKLKNKLNELQLSWWKRMFYTVTVESEDTKLNKQMIRKEIDNTRKEIKDLRGQLREVQPEEIADIRSIQGKVRKLEKRQHELYDDIERSIRGRPLKRRRTSYFRRQRSVKDGTPSDDELEELAGKLGTSWDTFGRRLGFNNAEIVGFRKDNEEYANKPLMMLFRWKEKQGSKATYQGLYDALCHKLVGRADLAEEFCFKNR